MLVMINNQYSNKNFVIHSQALDMFTDGVIIINNQQIITYINMVGERLFGYTAREIVGSSLQILFPQFNSQEEKQVGVRKNDSKVMLDLAANEQAFEASDDILLVFKKREEEIIPQFIKQISSKTGRSFFEACTKYFTTTFSNSYAFISEFSSNDELTTISTHPDTDLFKCEEISLSEDIVIKLSSGVEIIGENMACIPIMNVQKKVKGVVGICKENIEEDKLVLALLRIASSCLSSEFERHKNELMLKESKERYYNIVEQSPEAIFVYSNNKISYGNTEGVRLLGGESCVDIIGKDLFDFVHPDFIHYLKAILQQNKIAVKKINAVEGKFIQLNHQSIDVEVVCMPVSLPFMNTESIQIVVRDITERKQAEKYDTELRIRKQKSELLKLVKHADINNGNLGNAFKLITESIANTLGVERASIWLYKDEKTVLQSADLYEWSKNTHSNTMAIYQKECPEYFQAIEAESILTVYDVYHDKGGVRLYKTYLSPSITSLLDVQIRIGNKIVGVLSLEHVGMPRQWTFDEQSFAASIADVIGLAIEKSERKRVEERVEHLAYYDQLTNLPNRILLSEQLQHSLDEAKRKNHMLAVMFFDLDQFKTINDSLGHRFGDQLLAAVAKRIKGCVRQVDVIARMGGDEFVLILPKIKKKIDAGVVAERIISSFKKPLVIEGEELYITTSIGISVYPNDGLDEEELIKHADLAMYCSKGKGRNTYEFYSEALSQQSSERLIMETNLRKALEKKEFHLNYQPIIDLKTNAIIGVEALLRWNHPELGYIAPNDFIPVAEETGLIVPIGKWVLENACKQNKVFKKQFNIENFKIAVNLSVRQLKDPSFIDEVKNIVEVTGINPGNLELEITESIMQNLEESTLILNELKNLKINISLDDFGTGYSSLSVLRHLPIDTIKIDKSFVDDLCDSIDDTTIVKSIIDMSHSLGFNVVAEGIETEVQAVKLVEKGCNYGQGYLFSKPLSPYDLGQLLANIPISTY
jgi:diguanylate cyclase (GGDEF)-like protein/PAS domain S-box-containing protein